MRKIDSGINANYEKNAVQTIVAGMRFVRTLINEVFGNRLRIVVTVEERGK